VEVGTLEAAHVAALEEVKAEVVEAEKGEKDSIVEERQCRALEVENALSK